MARLLLGGLQGGFEAGLKLLVVIADGRER